MIGSLEFSFYSLSFKISDIILLVLRMWSLRALVQIIFVLFKQYFCCISNQIADTRKGKKERKQGKKGIPAKAEAIHGYDDGGTPDMGALCIWLLFQT